MDNQTFEHICLLSRIRLDESERSEFEAKFEKLLEFVDKVLKYEPVSSGYPMTLIDRLETRPDKPETFEWPEGQVHDYKSDQIIDFEGGS